MSGTRTYLQAARRFGTPLYVYDAAIIRRQCRELQSAFPRAKVHYALKANANLSLLKIIRGEEIGAEAVSPGELRRAKEAGFAKKDISFTCASLTKSELLYAARNAGVVHLDSLHQLETWGKLGLGKNVSLRLNQGVGSGHHRHTITGGPDSKFGIVPRDFGKAKHLAKRYSLRINGLSQHIGSGVLSARIYMEGVEALLTAAKRFPDATHLDFGGGLGIPYQPSEQAWDIRGLGKQFAARMKKYEKETSRRFSLAFEPGRYIVAQAGMLLATVTDDKRTSRHHFIGVNTGFNHLLRPALYGAYHGVENLSRSSGRKERVTIAGNICESGDIMMERRRMVVPKLGDVLAILDAGAYGMSMASRYNLRDLPKEVLIDGSRVKDISS